MPAPIADPSLVFDVREALAKRWLEVWYQPKVNLQRRVLAGAEALLRLRHPMLGIIPPSRFIPSTGSAPYDDMTAFVFETVARDWAILGRLGAKLAVSINASMELVARPSFLDMLTAAWPKMEARPPLIIEVTEGDAMSDLQSARESAIQLRLHGAHLSIDDFGIGYSTFARLRDLPFSEIKLDRTFVLGCSTDPKQKAICEATVGLARQFGILATAEGIEHEADCATIQQLGFDMAQGYFFARPSTFADFRGLLLKKARVPVGAARGPSRP
jgi:EAL domain-containing protein (putative c-di-GMP-specific phosphodiesterase class I)